MQAAVDGAALEMAAHAVEVDAAVDGAELRARRVKSSMWMPPLSACSSSSALRGTSRRKLAHQLPLASGSPGPSTRTPPSVSTRTWAARARASSAVRRWRVTRTRRRTSSRSQPSPRCRRWGASRPSTGPRRAPATPRAPRNSARARPPESPSSRHQPSSVTTRGPAAPAARPRASTAISVQVLECMHDLPRVRRRSREKGAQGYFMLAAGGTQMARLPAFFFGHGNPMNALQRNAYTEAWARHRPRAPAPAGRRRRLRALVPARARAVTAMRAPRTIHDFGGFPRALYEVVYPAPGVPELAREIQELLAPRARGPRRAVGPRPRHVVGAVPPVPRCRRARRAARRSTRPSPRRFHYELGRRLAAAARRGRARHRQRQPRAQPPRLCLGPPSRGAVRLGGALRGAGARAARSPASTGRSWTTSRSAATPCSSAPTPEHYLPLLYVLGARHPRTG